jgi:hypothetical protein
MKITAVRPKIPQRPAKPGLNAGRIQRLGHPAYREARFAPMRIPARATARAICTSPSHNRTIATVKMTAPTVSRAMSRAAPVVRLGAGKFVGIVRCPDPPPVQMRVSQLGRFHWPDLEMREAGLGL